MHAFALLLLQDQPSPELVQHILMAIVPILIVCYLIAVAIVIIPCLFILKKAGFTRWLSLLCIVPSLGTLVLLYVLAFADWKVLPAPPPGWLPPLPPQA